MSQHDRFKPSPPGLLLFEGFPGENAESYKGGGGWEQYSGVQHQNYGRFYDANNEGLQMISGNECESWWWTGVDEIIFGTAFNRRSNHNSNITIYTVEEGSYFKGDAGQAAHVTLYVIGPTEGAGTNDYKVRVVRGATHNANILWTSTVTIDYQQWYYIELHTVIDDSAGSIRVRIHDSTSAVIEDVTTSTIDTQNGGTGVCDRIIVGYAGTLLPNAANWWDDIYVLDPNASGVQPPFNNMLGDVHVTYQQSTTQGTYDDWDVIGATYCYTVLDDINWPLRIESGVLGDRASAGYRQIGEPALSGQILALRATLIGQKSRPGICMVAPFALNGGEVYGQAMALPSNYQDSMYVMNFNPNIGPRGVPFDPSDLNDAEWGLRVVSLNDSHIRKFAGILNSWADDVTVSLS
jgi:hypothetical protein